MNRPSANGIPGACSSRRSFLTTMVHLGLVAGMGAVPTGRLLADDCTPDLSRTLVNVMLQGGADFRFLFMPAPSHPDPVLVQQIWLARRGLYDAGYPDYPSLFEAEYEEVSDAVTGLSFGIHRDAGWLAQQFVDGRVAIVANAFCSRNRRHDQSILNADAGEPDLDVLNFDRSGWGGRLVEFLGAGVNSVELGTSVSTFNKGSIPQDRLRQVVHAEDLRDMSLASPDPDRPASPRSVLARALRAWYEAQPATPEAEVTESPATRLFLQHYSALRAVGDQVEARLQQCQALPDPLQALQLNSPGFALQSRNLYDLCQLADIVSPGVVSMNYVGWDTHDNESQEIRQNLADLFGQAGGLAVAWDSIAELPYASVPAAHQLTFYFASDFGRQLVANGTRGTDHGRGTYSIFVGEQVRGGIYGEMFPSREAQPDSDGRVPLQTPGADIEGRTSTDRLLAAAVDWVAPGAGEAVFPSAATAPLEAGVDPTSLFPA